MVKELPLAILAPPKEMKIFLDTHIGFWYIKITVRACTGFDRPAEDGEAIRGL